MEPQEIDKLFGERLKKAAPTPPADLWNRLQQRIETEMPAPQEVIPMAAAPKEEKRIMLWVHSYGIAATLALLLCAGIVFYNLRSEQPAKAPVIAQQDAFNTELPETTAEPAIAATEAPATEATEATEAQTTPAKPDFPAAPASTPAAPAKSVARAATKPATGKVAAPATAMPATTVPPVQALAAHKPTVEPVTLPADAGQLNAKPAAPATLAAAQPVVQPVEIIIKRSSAQQVAVNNAADEAEEELTGFEKKHRLAQGIFRQARNLSNGERIDLADLGINANKIAFETQIGKQKISKVINL